MKKQRYYVALMPLKTTSMVIFGVMSLVELRWNNISIEAAGVIMLKSIKQPSNHLWSQVYGGSWLMRNVSHYTNRRFCLFSATFFLEHDYKSLRSISTDHHYYITLHYRPIFPPLSPQISCESLFWPFATRTNFWFCSIVKLTRKRPEATKCICW